jgi:hypothetical protein
MSAAAATDDLVVRGALLPSGIAGKRAGHAVDMLGSDMTQTPIIRK